MSNTPWRIMIPPESAPYRWRCIAVALILVIVAIAAWLALPAIVARPSAQSSLRAPTITLSASVDGEPVDPTVPLTYITPGSTITPHLDIDWGDWGEGPSASVSLTLCGRPVEPGSPTTLTDLGACELSARVIGSRKSLWSQSTQLWSEAIQFRVVETPRYACTATFEELTVHIGKDGIDTYEIIIRLLSSEDLDLECLELSNVHLWLSDEARVGLGRWPVTREQSGKSAKDQYQAQFRDGSWLLHFELPSSEKPLRSLPATFELQGKACDGDTRVEFVVWPTAIDDGIAASNLDAATVAMQKAREAAQDR